ncbi:hypothetical protein F6X38_15860 [Aureimonas leprariae]|uniref:Uncharacterized protein n=1 Tax=Plantimonas leprariae TaxID=2615207 RepID=A0A7V7PMS7_9HYPH|nr:hypothetical protein [Aureimonas leprariae]KAB0678501.1 hypothetical protein F6X38_15860 [Aureimonas leprariae]
MKLAILTAAALGILGGVAIAQEDPAAPPPPPAADAGPDASAAPPPPPPGMGPKEMRRGPGGPHGDRFAPPPPPPPSKAAHFRIDLGENRRLDVKCADDEPMKACADIAQAMLDRIAPRP